jgi:hypothetical protein
MSIERLKDLMKFSKRNVDNEELIKPLLSQMKAEASGAKFIPPGIRQYEQNAGEYITAFLLDIDGGAQ